ncbi:hypothetical protein DEU38_103176 [Rhodococcus sp. AG1013]|uniref:hypothetical protein n=1 Tax=Rhodococcus sp. AG1013 TaxID=2183996 RepID=UPI000E0C15F1|nr:hypothetical protein [Rhodococcus sp. AG1013]RDI32443.1 hypothetical protein DEU38_103176 [Rhodococcus sp. AG1013]
MKLRRRPRPDSTAHQIAASMAASEAAKQTSIARRRIRDLPALKPGVMVASYEIPSTSKALPPQAVTAAAQVVFGKSVAKTKKRPPVASWQTEAWELRSEIPEFRFAGDRVARGASQYRLFAAKRGEDLNAEPVAVTEGLAFELCQDLLGDIARTQQALHRAGQQLTFNGESLLVVSETDDDGSRFSFAAHSVSELTGQGKAWKLNDGIEARNLTEDEVVIRCYRPDPQHGGLADCPARAVLPVARTLRGLGKRTAAEIDSRLAGAGLLLVSDQVSLMTPRTVTDSDSDPFVEELVESMLTPIQDPESAAAVVPLVAKVPDPEKAAKFLSFSTPLDAKLPEMEESAIRRVALGMDSPPETLLGMSTANHWTGWLISSEEVTLVLSPTVAIICHALTTGFLHPMLQAGGVDDWGDYVVWFDASELELRPDKSVDSRDLFEKGALSEEAMLRENGFSTDDAPTPEEKRTNLLTKLLVGAPSLAPLLLPMLGIEVDSAVLNKTEDITNATSGDGGSGDTVPDAETAPETGDRTPPEQPTAAPDVTVETGPGQ